MNKKRLQRQCSEHSWCALITASLVRFPCNKQDAGRLSTHQSNIIGLLDARRTHDPRISSILPLQSGSPDGGGRWMRRIWSWEPAGWRWRSPPECGWLGADAEAPELRPSSLCCGPFCPPLCPFLRQICVLKTRCAHTHASNKFPYLYFREASSLLFQANRNKNKAAQV